MILTLALGAFSASAAHTMDRNFTERVRYEVPADLVLYEAWDFDEAQNAFLEPPFSAHYVGGVEGGDAGQVVRRPSRALGRGASRRTSRCSGSTARRSARSPGGGATSARQPLGALLNALSIHESAVIVQPEFMQQFQVGPGDTITLAFGSNLVDFKIVEAAELLPDPLPGQGLLLRRQPRLPLRPARPLAVRRLAERLAGGEEQGRHRRDRAERRQGRRGSRTAGPRSTSGGPTRSGPACSASSRSASWSRPC